MHETSGVVLNPGVDKGLHSSPWRFSLKVFPLVRDHDIINKKG